MNWQNDEETLKVKKLAEKAKLSTYEIMMQEKTLKYNKSKPKKINKEVDIEVVKGFQELLKAPASLSKNETPSTITELMASIEPLKSASKPKNC